MLFIKKFIVISLFSFLGLYLFALFYLVVRYQGQLYYTNSNGITFVRVYDWLSTIENLQNTLYIFSFDDLKESISWFLDELYLLRDGDFINFITNNLGLGSVDITSVFSGDFWNILANLVNFLTFPFKLICTILLVLGGLVTMAFRIIFMCFDWLYHFVIVFFNPVVIDLPIII